jgi:hypothetical protein
LVLALYRIVESVGRLGNVSGKDVNGSIGGVLNEEMVNYERGMRVFADRLTLQSSYKSLGENGL